MPTSESKGGYLRANELLSLAHPPTAIVAVNDLMAIGVLRCARDREVRVPEELAVTGFDDIRDATLVVPGLSTTRLRGSTGIDSELNESRRLPASSVSAGCVVWMVERRKDPWPGLIRAGQ